MAGANKGSYQQKHLLANAVLSKVAIFKGSCQQRWLVAKAALGKGSCQQGQLLSKAAVSKGSYQQRQLLAKAADTKGSCQHWQLLAKAAVSKGSCQQRGRYKLQFLCLEWTYAKWPRAILLKWSLSVIDQRNTIRNDLPHLKKLPVIFLCRSNRRKTLRIIFCFHLFFCVAIIQLRTYKLPSKDPCHCSYKIHQPMYKTKKSPCAKSGFTQENRQCVAINILNTRYTGTYNHSFARFTAIRFS